MYGHCHQGNIRVLEGTKLQTKVARHGQRGLKSGANIHQRARGAHPTRQTRQSPCERIRNGIQNRQVSPDLQPINDRQKYPTPTMVPIYATNLNETQHATNMQARSYHLRVQSTQWPVRLQ